jgi:hypothetical protein
MPMKTRVRKTRIQVTLTPDALTWLEKEAELRGLSVSGSIEQLVRERMLAIKQPDRQPDDHGKELA